MFILKSCVNGEKIAFLAKLLQNGQSKTFLQIMQFAVWYDPSSLQAEMSRKNAIKPKNLQIYEISATPLLKGSRNIIPIRDITLNTHYDN